MIRICKQCKKEFHLPGWRDRPGRGIYCSRKCFALSQRGSNSPRWTDGFVRSDGYKCLSLNGKPYLEHRYFVEQHLGRKLTQEEVVHHTDGNRLNNVLSNLQLMTKSTHATLHLTDASKHIDLICPVCGKHFQRYLHLMKRRTPGCSRSCAAKLRCARTKREKECNEFQSN